jgi:hypothetical protein
MNKLVAKNDLDTALAEKAKELSGSGTGLLLKFDANTKQYSLGGEEIVELGRRYAAACDQYAERWTKFEDKRPVKEITVKLGEGKLPEREELDDLDLADTDSDPWMFQRCLPLVDVKTGEIVTFVSKSVGGKIAIGRLLDTARWNRARGNPIVKLSVSTFNTRDYGKRAMPSFDVVGYTTEVKAQSNDDDEMPPWPDDDADRDYIPE